MSSIRYDLIPVDYMRDAVKRYIEYGISPGGFLTAVITNNLSEAFGRADLNNTSAMREWVRWFYNEAPAPCWGSLEAMEAWMQLQQDRQKPLDKPAEK